MTSRPMPLGHTAAHSPICVQPPKPSTSIWLIIASARESRSGWPCGSSPRWVILAPTNSAAEPLGHAATHAPQPMQAAASNAACIGCGACVAACPNGSAALFVGAKITHLGLLPQGQPERDSRALAMINQMDVEGFGGCTQIGECAAVCPKGIGLDVISRYHREVLAAVLHRRA